MHRTLLLLPHLFLFIRYVDELFVRSGIISLNDDAPYIFNRIWTQWWCRFILFVLRLQNEEGHSVCACGCRWPRICLCEWWKSTPMTLLVKHGTNFCISPTAHTHRRIVLRRPPKRVERTNEMRWDDNIVFNEIEVFTNRNANMREFVCVLHTTKLIYFWRWSQRRKVPVDCGQPIINRPVSLSEHLNRLTYDYVCVWPVHARVRVCCMRREWVDRTLKILMPTCICVHYTIWRRLTAHGKDLIRFSPNDITFMLLTTIIAGESVCQQVEFAVLYACTLSGAYSAVDRFVSSVLVLILIHLYIHHHRVFY